MTGAQLGNIVLRLFGALWVVSGLVSLPQLLILPSMEGPESGRGFVIASAISAALIVGIGLVVYRKSVALATRMFPDSAELAIEIDQVRLLQVGFALLAVYLGVDALGRVAALLYQVLQYEGGYDESSLGYMWRINKEALVAATVELLACVALFLGSSGMAKIARAVRATPGNRGNAG